MNHFFQPDPFQRAKHLLASIGVALLLCACATTRNESVTGENSAPVADVSLASQSGQAASPISHKFSNWQHFTLPGKQPNTYRAVKLDNRDAMQVHSEASVSLFRQKVRVPPNELGHIKFSWKVPQLIAKADMAVRELSDSPVRIVLAFDGDRSRLSVKNAMLSELTHSITGEPMPYATLMYVWCNQCKREGVIPNSRTDRIQKLAVETGSKNLNHWQDYERDIRADFKLAFGEAPGALIGIAIMTDTDNTRGTANAWYGKVELIPSSSPPAPATDLTSSAK